MGGSKMNAEQTKLFHECVGLAFKVNNEIRSFKVKWCWNSLGLIVAIHNDDDYGLMVKDFHIQFNQIQQAKEHLIKILEEK